MVAVGTEADAVETENEPLGETEGAVGGYKSSAPWGDGSRGGNKKPASVRRAG